MNTNDENIVQHISRDIVCNIVKNLAPHNMCATETLIDPFVNIIKEYNKCLQKDIQEDVVFCIRGVKIIMSSNSHMKEDPDNLLQNYIVKPEISESEIQLHSMNIQLVSQITDDQTCVDPVCGELLDLITNFKSMFETQLGIMCGGKINILGRFRKIYKQGRKQMIKYKKQMISLSHARKIAKQKQQKGGKPTHVEVIPPNRLCLPTELIDKILASTIEDYVNKLKITQRLIQLDINYPIHLEIAKKQLGKGLETLAKVFDEDKYFAEQSQIKEIFELNQVYERMKKIEEFNVSIDKYKTQTTELINTMFEIPSLTTCKVTLIFKSKDDTKNKAEICVTYDKKQFALDLLRVKHMLVQKESYQTFDTIEQVVDAIFLLNLKEKQQFVSLYTSVTAYYSSIKIDNTQFYVCSSKVITQGKQKFFERVLNVFPKVYERVYQQPCQQHVQGIVNQREKEKTQVTFSGVQPPPLVNHDDIISHISILVDYVKGLITPVLASVSNSEDKITLTPKKKEIIGTLITTINKTLTDYDKTLKPQQQFAKLAILMLLKFNKQILSTIKIFIETESFINYLNLFPTLKLALDSTTLYNGTQTTMDLVYLITTPIHDIQKETKGIIDTLAEFQKGGRIGAKPKTSWQRNRYGTSSHNKPRRVPRQ